jgi:hypothetical protein
MHIRIFPVFFSTEMMLETQSAQRHGCMNLTCSNRSTSFTIPTIFGLKFRAPYLYGLKPALIDSRCSTSVVLNPGISV